MNHPNKSESPGGTGVTQIEKTGISNPNSMLENLNILDDWARISPVFSVQFSLKKGRLNCEWQPYLPPPKLLSKLAGYKGYFEAIESCSTNYEITQPSCRHFKFHRKPHKERVFKVLQTEFILVSQFGNSDGGLEYVGFRWMFRNYSRTGCSYAKE